MDDDGRVSRITLPTASFSLTKQQIQWIEIEAERRGVKKSVLVREIFDRVIGSTKPDEIGAVEEAIAS